MVCDESVGIGSGSAVVLRVPVMSCTDLGFFVYCQVVR